MFEVLAAAIHETDIPVDRPALVEVLRLADQLDARISAALGELDSRRLWQLDGARSLVTWLMRRGRLAEVDARQLASTAARLQACPLTRRAWLDGVLSGGQVRAIASAVTDATAAVYANHEVDLVPALAGLDVRDTTTVMRNWAARPAIAPAAGTAPSSDQVADPASAAISGSDRVPDHGAGPRPEPQPPTDAHPGSDRVANPGAGSDQGDSRGDGTP